MKLLHKWLRAIIFVVGMGIGLTATEANYTTVGYPTVSHYNTNPIINSNAYMMRRGASWECMMRGNCGTNNQGSNYYDQYRYPTYTQQPQGWSDNSVNNSFNTVNNTNIDYDVDNRHYYDIRDAYNQTNSNNTTTHTTNTTNNANTTTRNTDSYNPTYRQPVRTVQTPVYRQPVTPPVYQCKSGETTIASSSQCYQGNGATCYQRPDHKRCTQKAPEAHCPSTYSPVCGANGASYANSCIAQQAGMQVACAGLCPCNAHPPTPTYQCKSGETMVWGQAQCHTGYGSVCYQRPDQKWCTKKGTTQAPETCDHQPEQVCHEQRKSPRNDKYMSSLGLTIPNSLSHIQQYRIQWFDGSWSRWYTPGQNDIDWKDNCGDQYYQGGSSYDPQRPSSCARRVWSYFDDHHYEIKTCTLQYPENNHCQQNNYYYHQNTQPNTYGGYTTPSYTRGYQQRTHNAAPSSYSIPKVTGIQTPQASSSANTLRRDTSNTIFYGWNDQADYFANEKTYGFVDVVNNTFR